jgi:hypothetical protein
MGLAVEGEILKCGGEYHTPRAIRAGAFHLVGCSSLHYLFPEMFIGSHFHFIFYHKSRQINNFGNILYMDGAKTIPNPPKYFGNSVHELMRFHSISKWTPSSRAAWNPEIHYLE